MYECIQVFEKAVTFVVGSAQISRVALETNGVGINIRTSLKLVIYFQYLPKIPDAERTIFLSRVQNLVKINKELPTQ